MLKTLEDLGFSQSDSRVYIHLAKRGPQKAGDLAKSLKMGRQTLYFTIKNLQKKGLVVSTLQRPAKFSAVSFEKVLDLYVKNRLEEVQQIQSRKNEILSDWRTVAIPEPEDGSSKFTVIEGRGSIYSKIQQMLEETENQFDFVTDVTDLMRAYETGLFGKASNLASRRKIKSRFLTELSENNISSIRALLTKKKINVECRTHDAGLTLLPRMVIKDSNEALFFTTSKTEPSITGQDIVCLWTNCKSLVNSFSAVFEDLWENSTDLEKRIVEIETGRPSPKTCVLGHRETASKKHQELMHSAKKDILLLTSPKGLIATWKNKALLKDWAQRGVSVRIMAPITSENLETAQQLLKSCEIRHVQAGYLGTTIIDGEHLFQFKNPAPEEEEGQTSQYSENAFYTNDTDFVRKTENMLNDIWRNAQVPSPVPLRAAIQQLVPSGQPSKSNILDEYKHEFKRIVGFSYRMEPQEGKVTENEVLKKIANAKRIPAKDPEKDTVRIYGTQGTAIIHPPKNLNLPNFMIIALHLNKQSSFGIENTLTIYLQAQIADNTSYFPVTFVTDSLQGYKFREAQHKIHHTTEVARLVKKDELKVQANGNRLIVGWTVPIPLLQPNYTLPPGCIMFEGYGKTKSVSSKITGPLNPRLEYEYNTLDAFVTFMHPTLEYHGPGSDGLLHREVIITSNPNAEQAE